VTRIVLDDPVLVVLVGPAGAGKTTFAARHFVSAEILSSDVFRALISGNEAAQGRTRTVFSILHREVVRRLVAGRVVVVDATNVERHARLALVARARTAGVPTVAIVLALPADVVHARNAARSARVVDPAVVDRHLERTAAALRSGGLDGEGFAAVHVLRSVAEVEAVVIERRPSS
jgi:protein phosphatase